MKVRRKLFIERLVLFAMLTSLFLFPDSFYAGDSDSEFTNNNFSNDSRLDDTAGFIHLTPNPFSTLCETPFSITLIATLTDARVFELRFLFDQDYLQLLSVTPGSETRLHILPEQVSGDTLWLDGFFHPNFTGTTALATLTFYSLLIPDDDTTRIGFFGR